MKRKKKSKRSLRNWLGKRRCDMQELIKYAEKKVKQWENEQGLTDSRSRTWRNRQGKIDNLYSLIDRMSRGRLHDF